MEKHEVLMDLIRERASVRGYLERPVEQEKLDRIIEAARLAPSACNVQGWRFFIADTPDTVQQLATDGMSMGVPNRWAVTAPVIIAGCYKKDIKANTIGSLIKGIDYYQVDMGIAGEHMALMATALGLGTCWIGWFNEKNVRKLLDIPRNHKVVFLMTLGYPAEGSTRGKKRLETDEIVRYKVQ